MNPETKQLESLITDWLLAQCQEQYSSLAHIVKEATKKAKKYPHSKHYPYTYWCLPVPLDDSCQLYIGYDQPTDSYNLELKLPSANSYQVIGDLLLDVKNNAIKLYISSNIEKWVYKLLTAYFPIY